MISVTINDRLLWAGLAGLVGALFTGIGEGLLQFSPGADYAAADYGYFAGIDANRQSLGYFLSILSAPLYLLGYWHLTRNLTPTRPRLGLFLFMLMAYAFMIANVWLPASPRNPSSAPSIAVPIVSAVSKLSAHASICQMPRAML